jgi:hypothetical protein
MRNFIYTLGIIVLLVTFVSCTADELPENSNNQATTEIDPPILMPKP